MASPDKTSKRPWSIEENEALRQAISKVGTRHWNDVAALVPGRQGIQCMQHWQQVLDPALVKGLWTAEEDSRLREIKVNNPNLNWTEVASQIVGRSSKQCRERWTTNVDPSIKKTPFTAEEDHIIISQWKVHGAKWSIICEMLPGRAQTKVRDRFKQLMRKQSNGNGGSLAGQTRSQRSAGTPRSVQRGGSKSGGGARARGSGSASKARVGGAAASLQLSAHAHSSPSVAMPMADTMTSSALAALLSLRSQPSPSHARSPSHLHLHSPFHAQPPVNDQGVVLGGNTSSVLSFASRFNTQTPTPKKQLIQRPNDQLNPQHQSEQSHESPTKKQRLVEPNPLKTETPSPTQQALIHSSPATAKN